MFFICWWPDSNPGHLVSVATTLPTVPQLCSRMSFYSLIDTIFVNCAILFVEKNTNKPKEAGNGPFGQGVTWVPFSNDHQMAPSSKSISRGKSVWRCLEASVVKMTSSRWEEGIETIPPDWPQRIIEEPIVSYLRYY